MCGSILSCFGAVEVVKGREISSHTESFNFEVDDDGKRFVTMTHDEVTKNHPVVLTTGPACMKPVVQSMVIKP